MSQVSVYAPSSTHSRDHVLKSWKATPIGNPGSYIVVQDANVNGHPVYSNHDPGSVEAIETFLGETIDFEPDLDRERLSSIRPTRGDI